MISPKVDCVFAAGAEIGEGAVWSVRDQALFWVDVPGCRLHCHMPDSGRNEHWNMPEQVGCCAPLDDGRLVVALASGVHIFDRNTSSLDFHCEPTPKSYGHRFSEGTVDPNGRFLAGTSPYDGPSQEDGTGRLFAFDGAAGREVLAGFHTINGLAFSPDGRTAYASDSFPSVRRIWAWDYDLDDGVWHNQRLFFNTSTRPGRPDGAAIDSDGCYWMAGVGGWELVRLTPQGRVDMVIPFPVERPSRIAFGGSDLSQIFVTSISINLVQNRPQPNAGGLFTLQIPRISGIETPAAKLQEE